MPPRNAPLRTSADFGQKIQTIDLRSGAFCPTSGALGAVLAQLEHVAENRDLASAAIDLGESLERRLHRSGIGIVGIVDDANAAPIFDLHAHGKRPDFRQAATNGGQAATGA
jgi:hypothetical protein